MLVSNSCPPDGRSSPGPQLLYPMMGSGGGAFAQPEQFNESSLTTSSSSGMLDACLMCATRLFLAPVWTPNQSPSPEPVQVLSTQPFLGSPPAPQSLTSAPQEPQTQEQLSQAQSTFPVAYSYWQPPQGVVFFELA